MKTKKQNNKVAIIMGSQSDYSVMKDCEKILKSLKVKYQTLIVSAHRTPKRMFQFAETAEKNGFGVYGNRAFWYTPKMFFYFFLLRVGDPWGPTGPIGPGPPGAA